MEAPRPISTLISPIIINTISDEKMVDFVLGLSSCFDSKGVRNFLDENLFSDSFSTQTLKHLSDDLRTLFFDLRLEYQRVDSKIFFKNKLIDKIRDILDPSQPYYNDQPSHASKTVPQKIQEAAHNSLDLIEPIERRLSSPSPEKLPRSRGSLHIWKPCLVSSVVSPVTERRIPKDQLAVLDLSLMAQEEIDQWARDNHLTENEIDRLLSEMSIEQIETWGFINQKNQSDVDRLVALKLQAVELVKQRLFQPVPLSSQKIRENLAQLQHYDKPAAATGIPRCPGALDLSETYYHAIEKGERKSLASLPFEEELVDNSSSPTYKSNDVSTQQVVVKEAGRSELFRPFKQKIEVVRSVLSIQQGIECKITLDCESRLTLEQCYDCQIIAPKHVIVELINCIDCEIQRDNG